MIKILQDFPQKIGYKFKIMLRKGNTLIHAKKQINYFAVIIQLLNRIAIFRVLSKMTIIFI